MTTALGVFVISEATLKDLFTTLIDLTDDDPCKALTIAQEEIELLKCKIIQKNAKIHALEEEIVLLRNDLAIKCFTQEECTFQKKAAEALREKLSKISMIQMICLVCPIAI